MRLVSSVPLGSLATGERCKTMEETRLAWAGDRFCDSVESAGIQGTIPTRT